MNTGKSYKTRQRELLLTYLESGARQRPLSAREITEGLRAAGGSVGETTVYRCLELLEEEGSVRRYTDEQSRGGSLWQYVGEGSNCSRHLHLQCLRCGRVQHLDCHIVGELREHIGREHAFALDVGRTVLYGVCARCEGKSVENAQKEEEEVHEEHH